MFSPSEDITGQPNVHGHAGVFRAQPTAQKGILWEDTPIVLPATDQRDVDVRAQYVSRRHEVVQLFYCSFIPPELRKFMEDPEAKTDLFLDLQIHDSTESSKIR